ncbi:FUSC family protein [Sinomonas terrae]|uniref:Aromatic acid exporter family protein n=1 Tax=Sinomonas terrae TaxID=2908838 RepID=A0ABS9U4P4_9MICC|nr:aromatic acid exporter family protein [Sinomonas terrae]MCH6471659.1 aromatic acid exporter family protein [Sinomonas terrae]
MAVTNGSGTFPSREALGKARRAAISGLRKAVARSRLELAGKTALAAGLAWAIAPLMPGPAAHYPYYAPLGALVTMYPTVADSAKKGLQSLLGLGLGIGVAFAVAAFTGANAAAVAAVVGLGVLIGGLPRMGAASDWVPMAGLFVLVIGGQRADTFSLGYLLQMAVGIVVGFAVNWLILPPLHFQAIGSAFARQRRALAGQLEDMAEAMDESWPPDHSEWAQRDEQLARTAGEVRQAVHRAEVSARANPRRRRHPRDLGADLKDLRAIERLTFQVQDMTDVLSSAIWEERAGTAVPPELTGELSAALRAFSGVMRAWGEDDVEAPLGEAEEALDVLTRGFADVISRDASVNATASVAMSLRRSVQIVRTRSSARA